MPMVLFKNFHFTRRWAMQITVLTQIIDGGICCIAVSAFCGANMDFDRLRFVSERADSSETMLSVLIPEVPGAFRRLISHIEPRNVTEFSYRLGNAESAAIYLSYQAKGESSEKRSAKQHRKAPVSQVTTTRSSPR